MLVVMWAYWMIVTVMMYDAGGDVDGMLYRMHPDVFTCQISNF
jgi:hypothetical protein